MERLKKIWPFLASLGGASVMILAFFIPSIEDQWDRFQARQVIEQYEKLGNEFFEEEHFEMAEEAYAKAFELSEQKRLDLEVKRLSARINRIGSDPTWGSKPPNGLSDIDFQFLLHFQSGKDKAKHRVPTLNCYGVFLASVKRSKEAEKIFQEAIHLDSADVLAFVNLGNLYFHQGKADAAERYYRKAILLEPENPRAHYNMGLLLSERGQWDDARNEFTTAVALDPEDADAKAELAAISERRPAKKP
jgi:tetratricopeptide (TPR) repeat protein